MIRLWYKLFFNIKTLVVTANNMIFFANKNRPFHYGYYPLERLARDVQIGVDERAASRSSQPNTTPLAASTYGRAVRKYHEIFKEFCQGEPAAVKAPVPNNLERRMIDIKGAGYFLDASQIGICEISESCWYAGSAAAEHTHAIVIMAAYSRLPEADNRAHAWLKDSIHATAEMRAFEVAVGIANHIRAMGFQALAYDDENDQLDVNRLIVLSGLGVRRNEKVINPYLKGDYAVAIVSSDYALATDKPLARKSINGKTLAYWLGIGGATSGLERWRRARRASHLSHYPMETVKRIDRPTTLILDDEVPRVPKRAAFFERAIHGDLGGKAQKERSRFSFKHPFAQAMLKQIRAMVPHQDGEVAETPTLECNDAEANTRAIKSLSYALGAEIAGICELPDYAWYSRRQPYRSGLRYDGRCIRG